MVSALCQYLPESIKFEGPRVCPAVLLSIDDSDAVVCPALWEAILYIVATIEVGRKFERPVVYLIIAKG